MEELKAGDVVEISGEPATVTEAQPSVPLAKAGEIPPSAPPPLKAENLTPKQWRQLRKVYFTVRRDKVSMCGHKLDRNHIPRTSCEYCWAAYFMNCVPDLPYLHKLLDTNTDGVVAQHGLKFVKMFRRFMQGQLEQLDASDANVDTTTEAVETVGACIEKALNESNTLDDQRGIQGIPVGSSAETPAVCD